jgi:hypothetical protein
MICFRLTLTLAWAGLLALITLGDLQGDAALLGAYAFLFLTFPFGLIWALVAIPSTGSASPAVLLYGAVAVDVFTLFFWLILVPMLWGQYQRRRNMRRI